MSASGEAPQITCVGTPTLDMVFPVGSMPTGAQKFYAQGLTYIGGGPAANAAVAVSRLGGRASLFGCLGDDLAAERILGGLSAAGVSTDHAQIVRGASSSTSAIFVDPAGERMIVNYTDPQLLRSTEVEYLPFAQGHAILADTKWPAATEAALVAAAGAGIPGVLDFDPPPTHVGTWDDTASLAAASHIVFSAPALAARSGTDDPSVGLRAIAGETDAWLAVTLGGDGVRWFDGQVEQHERAFDVTVVDTLGAGDVFHGAFVLELARGSLEPRAVKIASAAAAIKCSRASGTSAIPDRQDLQTFLREHEIDPVD